MFFAFSVMPELQPCTKIKVSFQKSHCVFWVENVNVDDVEKIPVARISSEYGQIAKAFDFRSFGGAIIIAYISYSGPSFYDWQEVVEDENDFRLKDCVWVKGAWSDHYVHFTLEKVG